MFITFLLSMFLSHSIQHQNHPSPLIKKKNISNCFFKIILFFLKIIYPSNNNPQIKCQQSKSMNSISNSSCLHFNFNFLILLIKNYCLSLNSNLIGYSTLLDSTTYCGLLALATTPTTSPDSQSKLNF